MKSVDLPGGSNDDLGTQVIVNVQAHLMNFWGKLETQSSVHKFFRQWIRHITVVIARMSPV